MLLAVTKLEQAVLGHGPVASGRRTVYLHPIGLQIVDPQQTWFSAASNVCHRGSSPRAVKTSASRSSVKSNSSTTCPLLRRNVASRWRSPRLHVGKPVVGLRQDVAKPQRSQPAQTQALAIAMHLELDVQQLRHADTHLLCNQQRGVVHPFTVNGKFMAHAPSLPQSSNSR